MSFRRMIRSRGLPLQAAQAPNCTLWHFEPQVTSGCRAIHSSAHRLTRRPPPGLGGPGPDRGPEFPSKSLRNHAFLIVFEPFWSRFGWRGATAASTEEQRCAAARAWRLVKPRRASCGSRSPRGARVAPTACECGQARLSNHSTSYDLLIPSSVKP